MLQAHPILRQFFPLLTYSGGYFVSQTGQELFLCLRAVQRSFVWVEYRLFWPSLIKTHLCDIQPLVY